MSMKHVQRVISAILAAGLAATAVCHADPAPTANREAAKKTANVIVVDKMEMTLDHPALFYANDGLRFTLKLKNVSEHDLSFAFVQGISGTTIGAMNWKIKDVKSTTIWKVDRDPNPGPALGAPLMMGRKTLKPGESFHATVQVPGWGRLFILVGEGDSTPTRTARKLPTGTYAASLSVNVEGGRDGDWEGAFAIRSTAFEISAKNRPVVEKVRKTRDQIVAEARKRMVETWRRLKDVGNAECEALELADLEAATVKVDEKVVLSGIEKGRRTYDVTFLVPCKSLGGEVRFAWNLDEFARERSMTGVRLITQEDGR